MPDFESLYCSLTIFNVFLEINPSLKKIKIYLLNNKLAPVQNIGSMLQIKQNFSACVLPAKNISCNLKLPLKDRKQSCHD